MLAFQSEIPNNPKDSLAISTILQNNGVLPHCLAKINSHIRDEKIFFQDEGHLYTLTLPNDDVIHPISVTTIIHKYFPQFDADKIINKMMKSANWVNSKYFGKSKETIKEEWSTSGTDASQLGSLMHKDIENFFNQEPVINPNTTEFKMFNNFWQSFQAKYPDYKPYRTEWIVYDEDIKLSGSIDFILKNDITGDLMILDWKRSKKIEMENKWEKGFKPFDKFPNCNYSHYSLQLNIYRHILINKYKQKISFMMLVILHPDNDDYVCCPINVIDLQNYWYNLDTSPILKH